MYKEFMIVFNWLKQFQKKDNFRIRRIDYFYKLFGRYQDNEKKNQSLGAHSYTQNEEYKGGHSCTQ